MSAILTCFAFDFPILPIRPAARILRSVGARPYRSGRNIPPGFAFVTAGDGSRWLLQVFEC